MILFELEFYLLSYTLILYPQLTQSHQARRERGETGDASPGPGNMRGPAWTVTTVRGPARRTECDHEVDEDDEGPGPEDRMSTTNHDVHEGPRGLNVIIMSDLIIVLSGSVSFIRSV